MIQIREVIDATHSTVGLNPEAVPANYVSPVDMKFCVQVVFTSMGFSWSGSPRKPIPSHQREFQRKNAMNNIFKRSVGKILAWISRFLGVKLRLVGTLGKPSFIDSRVMLMQKMLKRSLWRMAKGEKICITPFNDSYVRAIIIADYLNVTPDFVDGETGWGFRGLTLQQWLDTGGEKWQLNPGLSEIPIGPHKGLRHFWPQFFI